MGNFTSECWGSFCTHLWCLQLHRGWISYVSSQRHTCLHSKNGVLESIHRWWRSAATLLSTVAWGGSSRCFVWWGTGGDVARALSIHRVYIWPTENESVKMSCFALSLCSDSIWPSCEFITFHLHDDFCEWLSIWHRCKLCTDVMVSSKLQLWWRKMMLPLDDLDLNWPPYYSWPFEPLRALQIVWDEQKHLFVCTYGGSPGAKELCVHFSSMVSVCRGSFAILWYLGSASRDTRQVKELDVVEYIMGKRKL